MISDDEIAKFLRENYIIKIVPMINIDGVITGNYRTSLAAKDLNRNYRYPRQEVFPVVWYIKEIVRQAKRNNRQVLHYVDLHGHSRKKSSFMFGCCEQLAQNPDEPFPEFQNRRMTHILEQRLLPFLCAKIDPKLFNFDFCAWSMRKSKESTGRVVMYKEFGIKNSFTLEATFAGTSFEVEPSFQFNQGDFMKIGILLAKAFKSYHEMHTSTLKKENTFKEIVSHIRSKIPDFETNNAMERASSAKNIGISVKVNISTENNFIDELGIPDSYLDRIIDGEVDEVEEKIELNSNRRHSDDDSDSESEPEFLVKTGESKKVKKKGKKKKKILENKVKVDALKTVKSEPIITNIVEKKIRKKKKQLEEIESLEKRVGIIEQSRRRSGILLSEQKSVYESETKTHDDKQKETKLLGVNNFTFPSVFKTKPENRFQNKKSGLIGHLNNNYQTFYERGMVGNRLAGQEKSLIKGTIPVKNSNSGNNESRVLEFIG